jgi:hypothetical protein
VQDDRKRTASGFAGVSSFIRTRTRDGLNRVALRRRSSGTLLLGIAFAPLVWVTPSLPNLLLPALFGADLPADENHIWRVPKHPRV